MWDVEGASRKCRLEDHRNYVQVHSGNARFCIDAHHFVAVQLHTIFAFSPVAITAPSRSVRLMCNSPIAVKNWQLCLRVLL